jgi:Ca2+-binding EF-hand superfamily protein
MNRTHPAAAMLLAATAFVSIAAQATPVAVRTGPVHTEMNLMDANSDGKLTRDEHANGAQRMFQAMDADKDGRVVAAEMEAAHQRVTGEKTQPGAMPAAEKIRAIDSNGDGALTAEEHAAGSRRMFEAMDINRDSQLTFPELAAGHRRLQGK